MSSPAPVPRPGEGARVPDLSPGQPADPDDGMALFRRLSPGFVALSAASANVCMQLANPAVGHGVVESPVLSGRADLHPFKRARTTVTYLAVALFGSERDRRDYRSAVDAVHRRVRSTEASAVRYNAFDPSLQLWVAACLYRGGEDVMTRLYGPLDPDVREALYRHGARLGTTLQVRPEMWPADPDAFDAYWREQVARIRVDPPVREYLLDLIDLRPVPWLIRRTAGPLHRLFTAGWLPPEFREAYGIPWSDRHQRRFDRIIALAGRVYRILPPVLRTVPFNVLLWDMRIRRRAGARIV